MSELKTSGDREIHPTGAQRDSRKGKGRPDLICPHYARRLSLVLEKGAEHYGDRNWEKGMPQGRFLESLERHILEYKLGDTTEDKLGQAAFNLMALISQQERMKSGELSRDLAYHGYEKKPAIGQPPTWLDDQKPSHAGVVMPSPFTVGQTTNLVSSTKPAPTTVASFESNFQKPDFQYRGRRFQFRRGRNVTFIGKLFPGDALSGEIYTVPEGIYGERAGRNTAYLVYRAQNKKWDVMFPDGSHYLSDDGNTWTCISGVCLEYGCYETIDDALKAYCDNSTGGD